MTDINKNEAVVETKETTTATENSKSLTAREIFEKIVELQEQLTKNSYHSLHRLSDAITSISEAEGDEKVQQVSDVCDVFVLRENTLQRLIDLYTMMYNDAKQK